MPSLNASSARSAERCSTTSSSSVRITSGASSPSTSASTTKRVRTRPSGTSSRFHGLSRRAAAFTQSPFSVGFITTTGVQLEACCARPFLVRTGFVANTARLSTFHSPLALDQREDAVEDLLVDPACVLGREILESEADPERLSLALEVDNARPARQQTDGKPQGEVDAIAHSRRLLQENGKTADREIERPGALGQRPPVELDGQLLGQPQRAPLRSARFQRQPLGGQERVGESFPLPFVAGRLEVVELSCLRSFVQGA